MVLANEEVKCWGTNYHRQIGYDSGGYPMSVTTVGDEYTGTECDNPFDVVPRGGSSTEQRCPMHAKSLWVGGGHNDHTCVILTTGETKCWGFNGNDQLGSRGDCNSACEMPKTVAWPAGFTAEQITMSRYDTMASSPDNKLAGMGKNEYGELGIDSSTRDATPQELPSWIPSWFSR